MWTQKETCQFQSPKSRIESPILMSSEIGCNKDCMRTCDTRYAIPKYSAQISDLRRARSAWQAGTRLEHPIISNNKLVIGCSGHSPARGIRWPPRLIISLLLLCEISSSKEKRGQPVPATASVGVPFRRPLSAGGAGRRHVCDALTRTRHSCRACAHAN